MNNKFKKTLKNILSGPDRKRKPAEIRAWEKDYPDYKLWDSQRWAWEFFSRNFEFIIFCYSINSRNLS